MDEDIWEDAVQEEIPVPEELEQSEAMYSEADAAGGDSAEIGSWAELKQMINECEVGGTITSTKVNQGQGARIGGGCNAAPGKITIGGGNITTSGGSGAGIGGGKENKSGVSIRGISAMLESDNTLRLYLGFKDVEPSGLTYMIDGQSAELKTRSDGASYLALDAGVYSNHLQDTNLYSISDGTNTYTLTMSVLTYNWGLKLLALLLAILVYYSLKTERTQVLGVHARDNGISIPKGEATTDGNQK